MPIEVEFTPSAADPIEVEFIPTDFQPIEVGEQAAPVAATVKKPTTGKKES